MVGPAGSTLSPWIMPLVPVVGGLIVGFIAHYGSDKIRGHGIPEAIEADFEARGFAEFGADGFGLDAEAEGGFLGVGVDEHDIAGFVNGDGHVLQDGEAAFVGGEVVAGAKAVEVIVKETLGAFDELAEGFAAGFLDEAVRVVGLGNDGDADGEAGGEQAVQRTDSGVLAGVIGIKAEDDFLDVAFEDAGVVGGEGGALAGRRCSGRRP